MMKPGVYQMSDDEYHSDPCPTPSLSSSIANILLTRSPYHAYKHHPKLGNTIHEESGRFDLGKTAHALLLEDNDTNIEVINADDWRSKSAKILRDEARASGKVPILARHFDEVSVMVITARHYIAQSELSGIFDDGLAEQAVVWQENGIWCRAKPDWLNSSRELILDYKTASSAEPDYFGRHIANMGYDVQNAFYVRGIRAVSKVRDPRFVFLAQELEEPYACSLHALAPIAYDMAEEKVERAIATWANCLKSDNWPAYPPYVCYQQPPAWAVNKYMDTMEREL